MRDSKVLEEYLLSGLCPNGVKPLSLIAVNDAFSILNWWCKMCTAFGMNSLLHFQSGAFGAPPSAPPGPAAPSVAPPSASVAAPGGKRAAFSLVYFSLSLFVWFVVLELKLFYSWFSRFNNKLATSLRMPGDLVQLKWKFYFSAHSLWKFCLLES